MEQYYAFVSTFGEWSWLTVTAASLLITLAIKLVLKIISTQLRKLTRQTGSPWDDVGLDILDGLKPFVVFGLCFYVLSKSLPLTEATHKIFLTLAVALASFQAGLWGLYLIRNWRNTVIQKRVEKDPSAAAALGLMYTSAQIAFIVIIVLIGLSNIGIDIGALLAGLGVGGIAVALAAQNILGDLLASLSIVLDKPFVVGDFIVVGTDLGTVEHIGLKTTRIRSLSGEELVFSNKDLLESRIRNYKRMWQRRVVQKFGVIYSTPADVLEKIPQWVREFVEKYPELRFDRCHFAQYGNSSLDFELVFWVTNPDYNIYMDYQQKLLLDIFRKFTAEKVEFAFPSQSLYVEKLPDLSKSFSSLKPPSENPISEPI